MTRRLLCLWISLLTLLLSVPAAGAAQKGSIEVSLYHNGQPLSGGTLTAIRVGWPEETQNGVRFYRIPDGAALENIQSADTARSLEDYVNQNKHSFETRTVSIRNGRALFSGLPTGLYLIRQKDAPEGFFPVNSFLVSLPYYVNGETLYQVTAQAKTELKPKPAPIPPEKLPQTGQLTWPIPVFSAAGMALLALGWLLKRRGK